MEQPLPDVSSAIASNTGPALSTDGGFQAFQFDEQGQIAHADNFLPGVLDAFKSDKGYVAVPWPWPPG